MKWAVFIHLPILRLIHNLKNNLKKQFFNLFLFQEMELLILSKLKWDLSAITPYDFLEYLLRLLAEGSNIDSAQLRRHTENFIILCATEFR